MLVILPIPVHVNSMDELNNEYQYQQVKGREDIKRKKEKDDDAQ